MEDEKENVVTPTETGETEEKGKEKEEKTYSRNELNSIISAEREKALNEYKKELEKEKTEAEKLSKMTSEQKQKYELEQKDKENEELRRKLNARDLKDEAIRIATTADTAFDPEFLNLFNFETMTAEELQNKTKTLKAIQDRIVEKAMNEFSKEDSPINKSYDKTSVENDAISIAFGNKK